MITREEKIEVMEELLDSAGGIRLWKYTRDGCLSRNADDESPLFQQLFDAGAKTCLVKAAEQDSLPKIMTDNFFLTWMSVPLKEGSRISALYVVGPILSSAVSEDSLYYQIQISGIASKWEKSSWQAIRSIPVIPHQLLIHYAMMLYDCMNESRITEAHVTMLSSNTDSQKERSEEFKVSKEADYAIEQEIMRAIEQGNINYSHPRSSFAVKVGHLSERDPLRQAKNTIIISISLACRAAIRGGLPADASYEMADYYIQNCERSRNVNDVYQIWIEAQNDYTMRVHQLHKNNYPAAVNACIGHIVNHINENITMKQLAEKAGYNKNYLGALFHQATGISINQYIMKERLSLAALRLQNSNQNISDIAQDLGFRSLSYFGVQFREVYQCTPSEYREKRIQQNRKSSDKSGIKI